MRKVAWQHWSRDKLRKKTFSTLGILTLTVTVWLALFPHSAFGASDIWTDTFEIYKDAITVYADIRTFTNNEAVPITITVQIWRGRSSIDMLQHYKLSANGTDFIIISAGSIILSKDTYYGLNPGEKLCFTVEAKPKDSAVEGNTATVEVRVRGR